MSEGGRSKVSKHKQNIIHEGTFDRNTPRPPVPGEESTYSISDWGQMEWKHKTASPVFKKAPGL